MSESNATVKTNYYADFATFSCETAETSSNPDFVLKILKREGVFTRRQLSERPSDQAE